MSRVCSDVVRASMPVDAVVTGRGRRENVSQLVTKMAVQSGFSSCDRMHR